MKHKFSSLNFPAMSGTSEDLPEWISEYPDLHIQVKTIREFQGISQKKLADNVGLTWRSIPNIESGKVNPKISTLKKIAEFLNCELKILLIPGNEFKKNNASTGRSIKTGTAPLQKNITISNKTKNKGIDDNQYQIEKKKEYFWE